MHFTLIHDGQLLIIMHWLEGFVFPSDSRLKEINESQQIKRGESEDSCWQVFSECGPPLPCSCMQTNTHTRGYTPTHIHQLQGGVFTLRSNKSMHYNYQHTGISHTTYTSYVRHITMPVNQSIIDIYEYFMDIFQRRMDNCIWGMQRGCMVGCAKVC